jgi:hypothetical protein
VRSYVLSGFYFYDPGDFLQGQVSFQGDQSAILVLWRHIHEVSTEPFDFGSDTAQAGVNFDYFPLRCMA